MEYTHPKKETDLQTLKEQMIRHHHLSDHGIHIPPRTPCEATVVFNLAAESDAGFFFLRKDVYMHA
jgi:hypothetical protein